MPVAPLGSHDDGAPMNRTIAFLLLVQKDVAGAVLQLQVALDRPAFDTDGQALGER